MGQYLTYDRSFVCFGGPCQGPRIWIVWGKVQHHRRPAVCLRQAREEDASQQGAAGPTAGVYATECIMRGCNYSSLPHVFPVLGFSVHTMLPLSPKSTCFSPRVTEQPR